MSSSTLYIGFRCPMTSSEAITVPAARIQKRSASMCRLPAEVHDDERRDQQIDDCRRQQPLPAELHQLVVAIPGQRPPHPDIEEEDCEQLDEEPDPFESGRQRKRPV